MKMVHTTNQVVDFNVTLKMFETMHLIFLLFNFDDSQHDVNFP